MPHGQTPRMQRDSEHSVVYHWSCLIGIFLLPFDGLISRKYRISKVISWTVFSVAVLSILFEEKQWNGHLKTFGIPFINTSQWRSMCRRIFFISAKSHWHLTLNDNSLFELTSLVAQSHLKNDFFFQKQLYFYILW